MRFTDPFIKVHFKNTRTKEAIDFKAFIEDAQHNIVYEDKPLPYATGFNANIAVIARSLQNIKLSINVYSEDREECYNNFQKLKWLLQAIQPRKSTYGLTYQVDPTNTTGLIAIKFTGLQPLTDFKNVHITSFSYEINKELGYILMGKNQDAPIEYKKPDIQLYPIGFKFSIEARIISPSDITPDINTSDINRGTVLNRAAAVASVEPTLDFGGEAVQAKSASSAGNAGSSGQPSGRPSESSGGSSSSTSTSSGARSRNTTTKTASRASQPDQAPPRRDTFDPNVFNRFASPEEVRAKFLGGAIYPLGSAGSRVTNPIGNKLLPALTEDEDETPVTKLDQLAENVDFEFLKPAIIPGEAVSYDSYVYNLPEGESEFLSGDLFASVNGLNIPEGDRLALKLFLQFAAFTSYLPPENGIPGGFITPKQPPPSDSPAYAAAKAYIDSVAILINNKQLIFAPEASNLGKVDLTGFEYGTTNYFGGLLFFNQERLRVQGDDELTDSQITLAITETINDPRFGLIPIDAKVLEALQSLATRATQAVEAYYFPKKD